MQKFSAINFRALLDYYQGIIALLAHLSSSSPANLQSHQPRFPTDGASADWRQELNRYEDEKRRERAVFSSQKWTHEDSLRVRMARTREIISRTGNSLILPLLNSESVIRLLSEKGSFIRQWGNSEAHQFVTQGAVLKDMVQSCAESMEVYEVEGLLHMIDVMHPPSSTDS